MHWVRVTRPQYEQSERYKGRVGEVVGRWGPENSASSREGWLVEFSDGEVVGVTEDEVEVANRPDGERPEKGVLDGGAHEGTGQ